MRHKKVMRFCDLLAQLLKEKPMTHSAFYTELGIKKPYFYDILSGKVNPPPSEKQFAIIKILKPDDETCKMLFELAAKERNEMPADLVKYLTKKMKNDIRQQNEYITMLEDIKKGDKENG